MSIFIKHYKPSNFGNVYNIKIWRLNSSSAQTASKGEDEEEFRVLDILKKKDRQKKRVVRRTDIQPDRADRMATDQNWGNVWPGPKTFHPSSVPLPVRQGYVPKGQAPPGKKANAELMKIPNFLHLTPPVIKMQCEAIKKFCTPWPSLLNSEDAIENHYPVEIITSDYCHASPSIRNPLARIATLRIKLSSLKLDPHSKDKFLRLVGDKYDENTELITITADRCPARKQNLEYVEYLLTACYHEAYNYEEWEKDKTEADMEYYNWDNNESKKSLIKWHFKVKSEVMNLTDEGVKAYDVNEIQNGAEYKTAVSNFMNDGENKDTLHNYAVAVRRLFGLPDKKVVN